MEPAPRGAVPVIAEILPACASVASIDTATDVVEALVPEEQAVVRTAAPARRSDFSAGRACAHRALRRLGVPDPPILAAADRRPVWPPGVVGSITHCRGLAAAAVAHAHDLTMLGIDAEHRAGEIDDIAAIVVGADERLRASDVLGADAGLLLFSAKESVYKAWHPSSRRWLDFLDITIEVALDEDASGTFRLEPAHHLGAADRAALHRLQGRFAITAEHVVTAAFAPNWA